MIEKGKERRPKPTNIFPSLQTYSEFPRLICRTVNIVHGRDRVIDIADSLPSRVPWPNQFYFERRVSDNRFLLFHRVGV